MKGTDILKWGFVGWLVYKILKEFSQPDNDNNRNHSIRNPDVPETLDTMYPIRQPPQPGQDSPINNLDIRRMLEESLREAFNIVFKKPILLESQPAKPTPDPQTLEAGNWLRLIPHPSIVVILGRRGSGKSVLGHRLFEHLRWTASPYIIGLPENAKKLLPDWVGIAANLEDVPPKAVVLVDEAYLTYHARSSMAAEAKTLSKMINLSRQREQTLIFVSQEARQVDRNIVSSANVVIFKDLETLQLKFDRRELKEIATSAKQAFATITGDKRKWAYVYSPDTGFMGLMENSLPTYWTEKLSHIFAAGGEAIARAPKEIPLSQRIERAKELKRQRLSNGNIARLMGKSKATIKNYLEDYPYRK
jgi:hypothetical protein